MDANCVLLNYYCFDNMFNHVFYDMMRDSSWLAWKMYWLHGWTLGWHCLGVGSNLGALKL